MSSMTFSQKKFNPVPPQKGKHTAKNLYQLELQFLKFLLFDFVLISGSFPLDHEGHCKNQMVAYMRCLMENKDNNTPCRQLSKNYLECRMEHNLMAKEEWNKLGFKDIVGSGQSTKTSS